MRSLVATALLAVLLAGVAGADLVVPTERVRTRVMVREQATRESRAVGHLPRGQSARFVTSQRGWHRVRLRDGTPGWVSAAWTRVVPETPPASIAATWPEPSALGSLGTAMRELLRPAPPVEIVLRSPRVDRTSHGHLDPSLPVAGLARVVGATGYDVVLVIDASASTNEYAGTDVDGDGRQEDVWKGEDSIFRAELAAAHAFLDALRELPGNQDGKRVRVGIVSVAGRDGLHRSASDRGVDPSPERILAWSLRDTQLRLPLTHDYDEAERALRRLRRRKPSGMTNLAAGIGRAVAELEGDAERGARSPRREGAQRIVHLLTDGKPRLPYDREHAERAALAAARLAAERGVTLHAFSLGRNAVTGRMNPKLSAMARATGGRSVELDRPGEIVASLRDTAFSFVDRVELVNHTTGDESGPIATGIDGSFYGELPLREGENEIEVVARLHDGRKTSQSLSVRFERVQPRQELVLELDRIRAENRALAERLKARLAHEMERKRNRALREKRSKQLELERDDAAP